MDLNILKKFLFKRLFNIDHTSDASAQFMALQLQYSLVMNRFCMIALAFFLLNVAGSFVRAQENPPLSFTPGWNLVGMPCDMSALDLRNAIGDPTAVIIGWNNGAYEAPLELHRGSAYFMNTNRAGTTHPICSGSQNSRENVISQLAPGWNLVGNPYDISSNLQTILARCPHSWTSPSIHSVWIFSKGRFFPLGDSERIAPWQGFFMYLDDNSISEQNEDLLGCSALCVDGSIPDNGQCPDVWLYFAPKQCVNSYVNISQNEHVSDQDIVDIRSMLQKTYGILVKDVQACRTDSIVPTVCEAWTGEVAGWLVSNEDAIKALQQGYVKSAFPPQILSADLPIDACQVRFCSDDANCNIRNPLQNGFCVQDFVFQPSGLSTTHCTNRFMLQMPTCNVDSDCDDDDSRTRDICEFNAGQLMLTTCTHTPIQEPACLSDRDCGDGSYCTNPGGKAAACVTPAGCPAKTIICSHPQGCDTILWNKPGCTGDNCQADPPGGDYSSYVSTTPGAVFETYLKGCTSRLDTSEQISGRTYFKMQSNCASTSPDQDEGYLRFDGNWQLFGAYEIRECVFRETLILPVAAVPGGTWDTYEPSFIDWTQTSLAHNKMTSRTECRFTNKDDSIQGEVLEFYYNAVDSYDEESYYCYIPGRGIVDRFNPGP